jgi:hypothetical protein
MPAARGVAEPAATQQASHAFPTADQATCSSLV